MRDFIRCKLYLNKSDFKKKEFLSSLLFYPSFHFWFHSNPIPLPPLLPDFKRIQVTKQLNAERKGGYPQPPGEKRFWRPLDFNNCVQPLCNAS